MYLRNSIKKVIFFLMVSLSMIILLAGCGHDNKDTSANKGAITITDVAGRTVTFDKPAKKVLLQYSGSGGAFMTLAAIEKDNFPNVIAGIDPGLKKHRNDLWQLFVKRFPSLEKIPEIGSIETNDFSVEKVISLKPDVIFVPLLAKKRFDGIISDRLEKAGIKVVYIDYHDGTLANHLKTINIIGKVMGKEERAKEIAQFYKKHIDEINNRVAQAKTTPTVYLEVGYKGPKEFGNSFGKDFNWGKILSDVRANSITANVIPKAGPCNPELVLEKNPQFIFIMGSNWQDNPTAMKIGIGVTPAVAQKHLEAFMERPGWNHLQAVENKQVYSVYHGLAREVYDFAAIEFIAKAIHPEVFKDVDPSADLKEFYDKFMPVPFEGVWFYKLQ